MTFLWDFQTFVLFPDLKNPIKGRRILFQLKFWISGGKIRIFISNPINPRMIWFLVIQDWKLFKVQFQQDFRTFGYEMDSWPTSTWTFWPYFKKLKNFKWSFFPLFFSLSKVIKIKIVFTPNIVFLSKLNLEMRQLGCAHSSSLRRFPVKMTGLVEEAQSLPRVIDK